MTQFIPAATLPELPIPEKTPGRHRILVVDDYAANILIATVILDHYAYDYDIAENGQIALALFAKKTYALILMDIQMPKMSGLEVTREIRSCEFKNKLHPTPIIALTANTEPTIREKCFASGMDGFITKPYLPEQLKDAITAALHL